VEEFSKNINAHTHPRKGASTFQDFEATYWKVMKKTKNNFCCQKKKKKKKKKKLFLQKKKKKKGEKIIWRW